MKHCSFFPFLFLLVFHLSSCKDKQEREKLVIYSPHGKELLGEFEKLYEEKHPSVDIEWLDMSSQEVFDRVRTEAQNPQADLWWGAPSTMFMRAEKMGLLQPYKPTWAGKVPAYAKSKNDFWYGTFSTPEVIAFNDKRLNAATAPKDWNDIIKPEWKDKVVLRHPMASGTLRAIFCAVIEQSLKETGNENDGWAWLASLNKNTGTYAADPAQMYTKLGGENEAVTLWNMPDIVLQKKKYNFPFGYVFPQSGTVVLTDAIGIVWGTKHERLAQDFYEFVTSPGSLLLQAEKYYRIPSRTDIPHEKLPEWLRVANYKALDIDWELIADKEADWMKRWDADIRTKNLKADFMFLELKNINKRYEGRQVLHNISLTVEKGKFLSLLGQSGCGKTTLLRIVAGLEQADSGRLLLNGKDVTEAPVQQRNIGIVFQNYALFPHMTVFDNIAYGLKIKKLDTKQIREKVGDALEKVALSAKAKQNVCLLSGGEQQRVALARAIVTAPQILLLDEPLSNLDHALRIQARAELKRLQSETGITTIYVTHDQSEALALSDKIAVLNNGSIVQTGGPREVYHNPANSFSAGFVGRYNVFDKKQFAKLFGQAGTENELVAVLPENLRLQKAKEPTNVFIKDVLFTGALTEYILASGSQVFKAVSFADSTLVFEKGECISLSVSKENIKSIEPLTA